MDKVYSLLGFAQRAGKIVSGEQGVITAIRRGKVFCLIIATDCSQNTLRRHSALAATHAVPCYLYGNKMELGQAVGKAQRALVAVLDSGFAQAIMLEFKKMNVGEKS